MTDKVWFITGAAKGLGYLIARDALRAGDKVAATSRAVDGLAERLAAPEDRLLALPLDVTDAAAVAEARRAGGKEQVFLPVWIVTSCPWASVFPCRVPALVVVLFR